MSNILEVTSLEASYGATKVLQGIDFSVPAGGTSTILGANGAGKTTTLRAISGMLNRTGEIRFDGCRIDRASTEAIAKAGIGHVPDGRGTITQLTVEENLLVGAYTRRDGKGLKNDFEKVYHYFPRLKERSQQQAGTLSGGEQQMLAIGRALMMRPKLLLMDEPSFGLAPIVIIDIFKIIRRINAEEQISVLLIEQNVARALEVAAHGYVMETGTIAIAGDSESLRKDDAVRHAYLGM